MKTHLEVLIKALVQPIGYVQSYNDVREEIIAEIGYDEFRELQKVAFKTIKDVYWKAEK